MKILSARLLEAEKEKRLQERTAARNQQIGSGDRSERIRTYNFTQVGTDLFALKIIIIIGGGDGQIIVSQDRVTDHRIGLTKFGIDRMLNGDFLDEYIDALSLHYQVKMLEEIDKQE